MSRDYKIQDDEVTYYIEAEPIIEDTSFDHEFGKQQSTDMVDVEILTIMAEKDKESLELDPKTLDALRKTFIKDAIFDSVLSDLNGGLFD